MTKVFTIADAFPPTHQLICKFTQVVEIMRCRTLFPLVSAAIRKKVDAVGEVLNCRQLHAGRAGLWQAALPPALAANQ